MKHETTLSILGAGWLGLPLGAALAARGYRVRGSTTRPEKRDALRAAGLEPFLITVDGHVTGEGLPAFFSSDVLLLILPPGRRRDDVADRYPRQVRAVYEAALAGGVRRMLFTSTSGVYGDLNRVVTEADAPAPERGSARAVAAAEAFLRQQTAIEVTILRLAGLVGGDRKAGRFLAAKTDVPHPDGPVNLVHRDDCIGVIAEILRLEKWGEIYNVCADEHPSRRDFYTAQARKEGLIPPAFRTGEAPSFKIVSNEKLKIELGYAFSHPDPMAF